MKRILAALMAAGACAPALHAQTNQGVDAAPITLDQALSAAGAASPVVEASEAGVRAAQAQRSIAGLRPNPSLETMSENVAGTGAYAGLRSSETTVSLAVPIELGGKRTARVVVADAQIGRASIDAAIARADLRLRVTQAFIAAAAASRRVVVARERVSLAAEVLRAASVRVSAGRASPLEQQRAEVARVAAEDEAEQADRTAEVSLQNLSRLIGMSVRSIDVGWLDTMQPVGPVRPAPSGDTLAAAAARADLSTAAAQVRLARSQRVPDVTVSAGARRLAATNDTAGVVSLSVPLPLFNSGRSGVALANAQRDQADANRRLATLDADQAIATAAAEAANAATRARNANGPSLAAAREAARIARIGYREGKFGQLDLLEAERTLAETRIAAIDALAAYHDAQAQLARLTAPAPEPTKDPR